MAQAKTPQEAAKALLERMNPEEKVGQLFLVTFNGPDAGPSTPVYDLITNYHIGGVILLAANDNFLAADQTLPVAVNLNRQLQLAEYNASLTDQTETSTGNTYRPAFIPLFIGTSQEGDGYPYDQILSGLTPLPSEMAIGATWQPSLSQQVGKVLGSELSALGFNLLLGPSLDVLESPHSEGTGDLGVRTFGGDPFWVGEMGKAFITGLHQGSGGEMAVVAKHFPGYGSSDRLPEEEVATVRKSIDQLKSFDLAPFFAVTGNATTPDMTVDALLTAHIRYQGFQENIRYTTKPVSFDQQAFSQLMGLPPLKTWRDNGGVMVSDELGGQAVRRFYESSGQPFIGRYVARDAFYAGNDMLYLGNFSSSDESDATKSIIRTLDFFTQKYQEDTAFAQRVDESVLRILTLKYRLFHGNFTLNQALPSSDVPGFVGKSGKVTFDVEQQAATLISPSQKDLIAENPQRNNHIVFITDVRNQLQCSKCPLIPSLQANMMEQLVIKLYGPQAGGQVLPANLSSYTFDDLQQFLNTGPGIVPIEADLKSSTWIIFNMMNSTPNFPSSQALRKFLSQQTALIQGKNIVVFAYNAPYYLDATDISKITAYYALYSKTPKSVEVAVRLLFHEGQAQGALPVSVSGAGYDLITATQPDPAQEISLELDLPNGPKATSTGTPAAPIIKYKVGDTIPVRTGVILDHNGNPVPDSTPVLFKVMRGEGSLPQIVEAQTTQGIARATIRVDSPGLLEISAESDPAKNSAILPFDILNEKGTEVPPTPTPTPTQPPTATLQPTLTPTVTPTVVVIPLRTRTNMSEWFLALLVTVSIAIACYFLTTYIGQMRWGLRGSLLTLIGGLLAYSYLAIGMPGSNDLVRSSGTLGVIIVTLVGAGAGWGISLGWRELKRQNGVKS